MYNDKNTAEEDIAGSIDLIIHLGRLKDGRIKVMSIHEICIDREDCSSAQMWMTCRRWRKVVHSWYKGVKGSGSWKKVPP